jgi:hypothetical protein
VRQNIEADFVFCTIFGSMAGESQRIGSIRSQTEGILPYRLSPGVECTAMLRFIVKSWRKLGHYPLPGSVRNCN